MSDKREENTSFHYLITALVILSFGLLYLLINHAGLFRTDTGNSISVLSENSERTATSEPASELTGLTVLDTASPSPADDKPLQNRQARNPAVNPAVNPEVNDEVTQLKLELAALKNQLTQLESEKTDLPQPANTRTTPIPALASPEAVNALPDSEPDNQALTLADITFKTGSAIIEPASQQGIQALANLLDAQQDLHLLIRGHTDNMGSPDVNSLLSLARSHSLKNALIKLGIAAQRINIEGVGSMEPIASNATPVGREQNRRLELFVTR